jgi:hypothetical protein
MEHFTDDEAAELLEEFSGVPWAAWRDLAREFIGDFRDGEVISAPTQA